MTELETPQAFAAMLQDEFAVLFIYAEWSKPASERSKVVEQWAQSAFPQHAPSAARIYRVHPWGFTYAANWIFAQPLLQFRNKDGNLTCLSAPGSLVWLRSGAVVDVAKGFSLDVDELNRRTLKVFTA